MSDRRSYLADLQSDMARTLGPSAGGAIRLRQERARVLDGMRKPIDRAERADRRLTDAERREYDDGQAEFERLTERIATTEADEQRDADSAVLIPNGSHDQDGDPFAGRMVPGSDGRPVRILAPDEQVATRQSSPASAYGALGTLAKSLAGSVSQSEVARWLPDAGRDMLSSGGGGVLVPAPIGAQVIDLLRARTVVTQLGARTVPMDSATLTIPRVTADPTAAWLAEGADITPTDGSMDSVTFEPKRLTALVKVSDELDEDSDPDLAGEVLANSLASAFAVELDRVALRGAGTSVEPAGVRNLDGTTVSTGTGAADWLTLTGMKRDIEMANSQATGFALSPRTEDAISTTAGQDGHFVGPPTPIAGLPRFTTTGIPVDLGAGDDETEVYAGNWADLMIGMRVTFELRRLEERYADEGKVALRARIRADVQTAHGGSFIVAAGVTN